jgi:hypothetical protein
MHRMRALLALLILALGACASVPAPPPLTGADIVALAKSGATPQQIIGELQRTRTVLALNGSDFVLLHEAGVPREVLDYLQRVQVEEIRWREQMMWGPGWSRFGCPYPSYAMPPWWGC